VLDAEPGLSVDYLDVLEHEPLTIAGAIRVGDVRLIDNVTP